MIYFDNSATTKPYAEVLQSYIKVSSEYFGNPSSLHSLGSKAETLLHQAREQIAGLLEIGSKEVIFTSGGTEGNNLAIKGAAVAYKKRGNHLITSSVEHPSIKETMKQLEEHGFQVTYLPVDQDGRVSVRDVEAAITDQTTVVSMIHVNNETGTVQPIEQIGEMLESYPQIVFHVDHVQGIGKVPLHLKKSRIDLCTISSHKFHGLKGSGLLYVREGVKLSPLFSGGDQENKHRSGTENVGGIVAMAKALRLHFQEGVKGVDHLFDLQSFLRKGLESMEGVKVHTPISGAAPHILNFSVPILNSETLIHALEEQGIFVSTTSACSSKKKKPSATLTAMGVPKKWAESAVRISLTFNNNRREAETVLAALQTVIKQLGKVMTHHEI